ncbi:branched-chain amino acid ABC transporter permease [Halalkalibacter krulwichiae]|uniref:High-affinity branched-chain amino acid transport system permease protein LivH n=1 Tax=Halalkalibacter krulwichiae TaxID=199441 RepID=A0A1X9MH17_9BACI|nr:branched-chain amino acid ABC transporter permease [Halalkalibacter krulwichiae]ARK29732.1 High-affinity branched-chain amino acid transport system permease protein LivH [Halalkalibacter krulwichiae]
MQFLLELLFMGVCVGAAYSLIAHGFNLTFWTMKVVNFAHGPFIMFCSMLILTFALHGMPLLFAVFLGLVIISLLGVVLERVSVSPLVKNPTSMGWVVSTLGMGIFLQALATKVWGAQAISFPDIIFTSTDYISVFGVQLSAQYLLVLVVSIGIMILLEVIMNRTIWGKAMKGVAHDAKLARLLGINSKLVVSLSFLLSALLAGIAGTLIAPIYGAINPAFGMNLMVLGFVAVVLGGIGNSKGALIGGLSLGVIEKLVGGYISTAAEHGVAFAILILILAIKPEGIFGKKVVEKV